MDFFNQIFNLASLRFCSGWTETREVFSKKPVNFIIPLCLRSLNCARIIVLKLKCVFIKRSLELGNISDIGSRLVKLKSNVQTGTFWRSVITWFFLLPRSQVRRKFVYPVCYCTNLLLKRYSEYIVVYTCEPQLSAMVTATAVKA